MDINMLLCGLKNFIVFTSPFNSLFCLFVTSLFLLSLTESPVDGGAWWAAVCGVEQSRTRLKQLSMHAYFGEGNGNPLQYSCLENPRHRGAW